MTDLYAPFSISCLTLFSGQKLQPAVIDQQLGKFFNGRNWQMMTEHSAGEEKRYTGRAGDFQCEVAWVLVYDVLMIRVQFIMEDQAPLSKFAIMRSSLDTDLAELTESSALFKPWAMTTIYQLSVSSEITLTDAQNLTVKVQQTLGLEIQQPEICPTPYGVLSLLGEAERTASDKSCLFTRTMLIITPEGRLTKVSSHFLKPLNQGVNRIELYLQKCEHLVRQYFLIQNNLAESQEKLHSLVSAELIDKDLDDIRRENQELDRISTVLMRLLVMKAQLDILLNSLTLNLKAYKDHLDLMKLEISLYDKKTARLGRYIESLQVDIENAKIAIESSYTFQEIQRSLEASRFERASFLLGATAALLAGVTIFNSYLDIWILVISDTNLVLPSPLIRMLLGLLAAVSWPLAAFWGAKRNKWATGLAILGGILSLVLAYFVSISG
jgi:hypothetical protein